MELLGIDFDISGHSTALYSTYWMIEPLGVLFDCGDGAASFFQQKGRVAKYIACSHPDRDHLAGLAQFLQLNSRPGAPTILYPEGSGSFPALRSFIEKFDPHAAGSRWQGIRGGERIRIKKDWYLECYVNQHIPQAPGDPTKSLSYSLVEERKKLKPDYIGLRGAEIARLRNELGEEAITDTIAETIISYSADTPVEAPEFWRNPKILIHEATFLTRDEATSRQQEARHSVLDEVLEMAGKMESLEALVLGHFSTRYHAGEIRAALTHGAAKNDLKFPVYALFPGEAKHHILSGEPIWKGTQTN